MRKSAQEDIDLTIQNICHGDFDRRSVKLLLLEIREYIEPKKPLRDIANFIHSSRNSGNSFESINNKLENFLQISKFGGTIVVSPIYKPLEIIDQLIEFLVNHNFQFDHQVFKKQAPIIIQYISEFLDGTKILPINKTVENCEIKFELVKDKKELFFIFNIKEPIDGPIRLTPTAKIAMPFFDVSD